MYLTLTSQARSVGLKSLTQLLQTFSKGATMANRVHINIKTQGGITCARQEKCFNPKNGALLIEDFNLKGGEYRDKTCSYCRRRLDRELKRKKAYEKRRAEPGYKPARAQHPKPFDWSEFEKCPWDVRLANEMIKVSW